jgi:uncharacterized protein YebE (UPF0316 family)
MNYLHMYTKNNNDWKLVIFKHIEGYAFSVILSMLQINNKIAIMYVNVSVVYTSYDSGLCCSILGIDYFSEIRS